MPSQCKVGREEAGNYDKTESVNTEDQFIILVHLNKHTRTKSLTIKNSFSRVKH